MALLAQIQWTTVAFLGGLGFLVSALLLRTHRQLQQTSSASRVTAGSAQTSTRPERRIAPTRTAPHNLDVPAQVREWEVRMHDLARDLSAQLDSKQVALQQLLGAAARQAAQLETLLERVARASQRPARDAPSWPEARAATQASGLTEAAPAPSARLRVDGPGGAPRPYEEIFRLADLGHGSQEIAQRVGSPVGEVELILGLRNNLD